MDAQTGGSAQVPSNRHSSHPSLPKLAVKLRVNNEYSNPKPTGNKIIAS